MLANKSLERTVNCRGHTVRAFAIGARAGVEAQSWPAVQRSRWKALCERLRDYQASSLGKRAMSSTCTRTSRGLLTWPKQSNRCLPV